MEDEKTLMPSPSSFFVSPRSANYIGRFYKLVSVEGRFSFLLGFAVEVKKCTSQAKKVHQSKVQKCTSQDKKDTSQRALVKLQKGTSHTMKNTVLLARISLPLKNVL